MAFRFGPKCLSTRSILALDMFEVTITLISPVQIDLFSVLTQGFLHPAELGHELQQILSCADAVDMRSVSGSLETERSNIALDRSHTILRHCESDTVDIVDSTLHLVEIDRSSILCELQQNSSRVRTCFLSSVPTITKSSSRFVVPSQYSSVTRMMFWK